MSSKDATAIVDALADVTWFARWILPQRKENAAPDASNAALPPLPPWSAAWLEQFPGFAKVATWEDLDYRLAWTVLHAHSFPNELMAVLLAYVAAGQPLRMLSKLAYGIVPTYLGVYGVPAIRAIMLLHGPTVAAWDRLTADSSACPTAQQALPLWHALSTLAWVLLKAQRSRMVTLVEAHIVERTTQQTSLAPAAPCAWVDVRRAVERCRQTPHLTIHSPVLRTALELLERMLISMPREQWHEQAWANLEETPTLRFLRRSSTRAPDGRLLHWAVWVSCFNLDQAPIEPLPFPAPVRFQTAQFGTHLDPKVKMLTFPFHFHPHFNAEETLRKTLPCPSTGTALNAKRQAAYTAWQSRLALCVPTALECIPRCDGKAHPTLDASLYSSWVVHAIEGSMLKRRRIGRGTGREGSWTAQEVGRGPYAWPADRAELQLIDARHSRFAELESALLPQNLVPTALPRPIWVWRGERNTGVHSVYAVWPALDTQPVRSYATKGAIPIETLTYEASAYPLHFTDAMWRQVWQHLYVRFVLGCGAVRASDLVVAGVRGQECVVGMNVHHVRRKHPLRLEGREAVSELFDAAAMPPVWWLDELWRHRRFVPGPKAPWNPQIVHSLRPDENLRHYQWCTAFPDLLLN